MRTGLLFVVGLVLASQVLGRPQVAISDIDGATVAEINKTKDDIVIAIDKTVTTTGTTPLPPVVVVPTTLKTDDVTTAAPTTTAATTTTEQSFPDRIRETIRGAITGAGQAIRLVPATITGALQNFSQGIRGALAPRPRPSTTPAPETN